MKPDSTQNSPPRDESDAARQSRRNSVRKRRVVSSSRALTVTIGIVVGLIVLGVVAKSLYPVVKRLRARRLARQTLVLIDAGKYSEAKVKLPGILQLAKDDPEVLRAAARYCTALKSPSALEYWERLRGTGQATVDDLLGFTSSALDANRTDLSAPVVTYLVGHYPTRIDVLHIGMRHLDVAGFPDRAIELGRRALTLDSFNPKTERLLGQLLLSRPDKALNEEGRALLWGAAEHPGVERDAALVSLSSYEHLTSSEMADLIRLFEADAAHDLYKRLRVVDLRWRLNPENRPELAKQVTQWLASETILTNFIQIASWAVKSSPESIAQGVTEARAATNQVILLHLTDALAELGRWPQIHGLLEKYDKMYPPFALDMLLGREAAWAHQPGNAEKYLLSAGTDADGDPRKLSMAASFAETQGFVGTAIKLWELMLNSRANSVVAVAQILRLCKNRDDLAAEQRALHRLSTEAPADLRLAAESAERDVLVNVDPGPAIAVLEKQIAAEPNELRWRFDAALGDLRLKNPSGALTRLEQIEINESMLTPRLKVIYAAVLGANQQREAARRYSRQLATEDLKSQERELIQPYL